MVYKITVDAVIDKITTKDLLSCSQNKETLSTFLAAQLIECKKDSQTTYVVTSKGDCMASNSLPIQHLRSEQEEADTRMRLHAPDATQRGGTSITIQSPDTDVLVLTLWVYKRLCPDTTVIVGTGGKRSYFLNCVPKITYLCSKLCNNETHTSIYTIMNLLYRRNRSAVV